jgi:hypothetical protein
MKIPAKTVKLDKLGYDDYWVKVPRAIKEGFANRITYLAGLTDQPSTNGTGPTTNRQVNMLILDLVQDWNLTGDEDSPWPDTIMPLPRTLSDERPEPGEESPKEQVVSEIPVDIIAHIVTTVTGQRGVDEETKDFSAVS